MLFVYYRDRENCPLYGVVGCPLFRGCLSIKVNGKTVETFRIVWYIMGVHSWGVFVKRGSTVVVTNLLRMVPSSRGQRYEVKPLTEMNRLKEERVGGEHIILLLWYPSSLSPIFTFAASTITCSFHSLGPASNWIYRSNSRWLLGCVNSPIARAYTQHLESFVISIMEEHLQDTKVKTKGRGWISNRGL